VNRTAVSPLLDGYFLDRDSFSLSLCVYTHTHINMYTHIYIHYVSIHTYIYSGSVNRAAVIPPLDGCLIDRDNPLPLDRDSFPSSDSDPLSPSRSTTSSSLSSSCPVMLTMHGTGCSVLQCVAVRCSVLQCVAVCCCVLPRVAVCCRVLQCDTMDSHRHLYYHQSLSSSCRVMLTMHRTCCRVLQCVAVCCSMLRCVAVCCSVV